MKEMHIKVKHIFESEKITLFLRSFEYDVFLMNIWGLNIWHLRKTVYAHAPFRILRKLFLLCFGHLFGVMVCSVCHSSLRQTVRPSVCPSVPAFASTFHHRLPWYFIRWLKPLLLVAPKFPRSYGIFQGYTGQKKPSETGQIQGFRVFAWDITMAEPWAIIQVCSSHICMVQCTHLITTGGTPHLYNKGSSMLVNSLHSGENNMEFHQ